MASSHNGRLKFTARSRDSLPPGRCWVYTMGESPAYVASWEHLDDHCVKQDV